MPTPDEERAATVMQAAARGRRTRRGSSIMQRVKLSKEAIEAKAWAMKQIQGRKTAFEYDIGSPLRVLFSYKGTFWPYVRWRYELYFFPILHTAFVMAMWRVDEEDDNSVFWGASAYMVPWGSLGLLTPLMIFFLVFFLSQCFSRFTDYFNTCMDIEAAVQDLTMVALTAITDEHQAHKWDCVRYATAAALVIYFRVTDLAEPGKDAQLDIKDWGRLLKSERGLAKGGAPR